MIYDLVVKVTVHILAPAIASILGAIVLAAEPKARLWIEHLDPKKRALDAAIKYALPLIDQNLVLGFSFEDAVLDAMKQRATIVASEGSVGAPVNVLYKLAIAAEDIENNDVSEYQQLATDAIARADVLSSAKKMADNTQVLRQKSAGALDREASLIEGAASLDEAVRVQAAKLGGGLLE